MRCPRCGKENVANAQFCVYCHTLFKSDANVRQRPPVPAKAVKAQPAVKAVKAKQSKTMVILIAALGAVLVALIVLIAVLALSSSGGKKGGGGGGGGSASNSIAITSTTPKPLYTSGKSYSNYDIVLSFSDNDLAAGTGSELVYAYADTGYTGESVTLYDSEGNAVCAMYDDGDTYTSGDRVADDGIYTAPLNMYTDDEASYCFYANIDNSSMWSNDAKLTVMAPLTKQELADMKTVDEGLELFRYNIDFAYLTTAERGEIVSVLLQEYAEMGLVDADSIYVDHKGGVVTFCYSCGVMGGEFIAGTDMENSAAGNVSTRATLPEINGYDNVTGYEGDALFLYATDTVESVRYPVVQQLVNDWTAKGLSTDLDSYVTIEDFKRFSGYDFVCIDAHGMYTAFANNEKMTHLWYTGLERYEGKQKIYLPLVFTLEEATQANDALYAQELKAGRVVKIGGSYGITPSFFDKYYDGNDIDGSIIYFTCCQFMGAFGDVNEEWPETLVAKNVDAVIGYHNSVFAGYCYDKLGSFVPDLINGATVKQAFENALHLFGRHDVLWYSMRSLEGTGHTNSAYPINRGQNDATLGNLAPNAEFPSTLKSKGIYFGDEFYVAIAEVLNLI